MKTHPATLPAHEIVLVLTRAPDCHSRRGYQWHAGLLARTGLTLPLLAHATDRRSIERNARNIAAAFGLRVVSTDVRDECQVPRDRRRKR